MYRYVNKTSRSNNNMPINDGDDYDEADNKYIFLTTTLYAKILPS
jgi:hypothetical protein